MIKFHLISEGDMSVGINSWHGIISVDTDYEMDEDEKRDLTDQLKIALSEFYDDAVVVTDEEYQAEMEREREFVAKEKAEYEAKYSYIEWYCVHHGWATHWCGGGPEPAKRRVWASGKIEYLS